MIVGKEQPWSLSGDGGRQRREETGEDVNDEGRKLNYMNTGSENIMEAMVAG